jgi:hypothetical protein
MLEGDDFTHYKGYVLVDFPGLGFALKTLGHRIYTELADQYKIMDATSNVVRRNVLVQHLREVSPRRQWTILLPHSRKAGSFFPANRHSDAILDVHFHGAGLPQVADWWRKQNALMKDTLEREDQTLDVRCFSSHFLLVLRWCRSSLLYASLLKTRKPSTASNHTALGIPTSSWLVL